MAGSIEGKTFVHGPDEHQSDTCYYAQQEFLVDSVEAFSGDGDGGISLRARRFHVV